MVATTRLAIVPVPDMERDLRQARRVIEQNFRSISETINAAISSGALIGPGSVTIDMLAAAVTAFSGDLTGTLPAGTVVGLRGKSLTAPSAGDNGKAITYNSGGSGSFGYTSIYATPTTTRGDLIYRAASADARLAIGAANTLLKSDGTDPGWSTLTALIDAAIGSTQGNILYRNGTVWTVLAPGTAGHFLKTGGAGADPSWAAGGGSPLTTKGDIFCYSTADDRLPVGTDGHVLTADSTQAKGIKWAAAASAGTNALLDGSTHTDTLAGTVVRGDLIYGNSTPKWERKALGAKNKVVRSDGTDLDWQFNRADMANSAFVVNGAFGNNTIFNAGIQSFSNSGGTQAAGGDSDRVCNKYTQSVANSKTGPQGPSSGPLITPAMSPVFWADFKLVTFTLCYLQCGFNSNGIQGSATKATTTHQAWLTFLAGTDTNFYFRLCDASTANAIDTGVAKDTAWHDVLIYSPDAGTTWKCELDGVQVASSSSNVPTTSQTLYANVGFTCGSGGTQTGELRTSYCKVQQAGRM